MDLLKLILSLVKQPRGKVIVEIGAHEDCLTKQLASHFKQVFSYYEFIKIRERTEGNLVIKRLPYLKVLEKLCEFDVILVENEFHHFPDIWQMWTYEKLQKNQDFLLVETNFKGNTDNLYRCFQNCRPLSVLVREILEKFEKRGKIKTIRKIESRYEEKF